MLRSRITRSLVKSTAVSSASADTSAISSPYFEQNAAASRVVSSSKQSGMKSKGKRKPIVKIEPGLKIESMQSEEAVKQETSVKQEISEDAMELKSIRKTDVKMETNFEIESSIAMKTEPGVKQEIIEATTNTDEIPNVSNSKKREMVKVEYEVEENGETLVFP